MPPLASLRTRPPEASDGQPAKTDISYSGAGGASILFEMVEDCFPQLPEPPQQVSVSREPIALVCIMCPPPPYFHVLTGSTMEPGVVANGPQRHLDAAEPARGRPASPPRLETVG